MTPVFIGGCDRSGTTYLGSLLGAHSACVTTPESQFKTDALRLFEGQGPLSEEVVNYITSHWRLKLWELDSEAFGGLNRSSYTEFLSSLVSVYQQGVAKPEAKLWIDHTPNNLSYSHALLELFPEAKFVHIVRDGRAVAASVLPLDWGPNTADHAARWWLERLSSCFASELGLSPERILRVRYEDLVSQPEETLKTLCKFLGLEFEGAMAQGGGLRVPGYTRTQHQLVEGKPDPSRIDRWKKTLSSREIELFEFRAADVLQHLGYPLVFGVRARRISRQENLKLNTFNTLSWFKHRLNRFSRIRRALKALK
jgi:hypothetical protein